MNVVLILLLIGLLVCLFLFLLEVGVIETFLNIFLWVYFTINPKRTSSKVIVALVSISFGFFYILVGVWLFGVVGLLVPFFLDPIGTLVYVVIVFLVYSMLVAVVTIAIKPLERQSRKLIKKEDTKMRTQIGQSPTCIVCSKPIYYSHYTCRNCDALFCTDKQCVKRSSSLDGRMRVGTCPKCGTKLGLDFHQT